MASRAFAVLAPNEGAQFQVFGSTMRYKATAETTGGSFSLSIETTAPGAGLPLHVHHGEDEVMYILDGEYEVECDGRVARVGAGSYVFLPRDLPNRYQNVGASPGRFLHFTTPGGFERVVAQTSALFAEGHPDPAALARISREHGIEFL